MAKIIECVPNFSEGIDQAVIDAISHAIQATDGMYPGNSFATYNPK